MSLIAIIIPCFNEQARLVPRQIITFLEQNPSYHFIFVNDGSTDKTGSILNDLQIKNPIQAVHLELKTNTGKANAVREGFLFSLVQKKYSYLGYWDADLSTSLNELIRMTGIMQHQKLDFVFGSRMKKFKADIQRSGFRHLAGRIITTILNGYFGLGIYDTQCGAKLFSAGVAEIITKESFVSTWLFDVEIFLRIESSCPDAPGEEIPLLEWKSKRGSKISILNTPGLIIEIYNLMKSYPKKNKLNV